MEVDVIRHLRAFWGWTYDDLARTFVVSKSTIADICKLRTRRPVVLPEVLNVRITKRRNKRRR